MKEKTIKLFEQIKANHEFGDLNMIMDGVLHECVNCGLKMRLVGTGTEMLPVCFMYGNSMPLIEAANIQCCQPEAPATEAP